MSSRYFTRSYYFADGVRRYYVCFRVRQVVVSRRTITPPVMIFVKYKRADLIVITVCLLFVFRNVLYETSANGAYTAAEGKRNTRHVSSLG